MEMYKQFRIDKRGNLHPLFVFSNETIPQGVWLKAKPGNRLASGKVASKLGGLAYRPGWHLSEAPFAPHIGIKEHGKIKYMHDDTVWALCEVYDDVDYTEYARSFGMKNGKFNPRDAHIGAIPENGYYWYNTNPKAFGNWMIADRIMVKKVLNDEETANICKTMGIQNPILHRH